MGPCMSMMGMSLPELPFPADEVVAQIQAIVGGIPAAYESEHAKLVSEYETAKLEGRDLDVKTNKTKLGQVKKDEAAFARELKKFAFLIVGKGEFADKVADQVWAAIEPKVDEKKGEMSDQLPDLPGLTKDQVWEKVKSPVASKTKAMVKAAVSKACDEAIAKLQ